MCTLIKVLFLIVLSCISANCIAVHYLEHGEVFPYNPALGQPNFNVFCYRGRPKFIVHVWQSVLVQIDHKSDHFHQFDGTSPEAVNEQYLANKQSWSLNIFTSVKQKNFKLDPFNISCLGLDSREPYSIALNVIRIDLWKVLLLVFGVFLFVSARKLSDNTLFYYVCGVAFGICTSFLVLIYLLSKLIPRKSVMYGALGFGWSIVIYSLQLLWENLRDILVNYKVYVLWYFALSSLISFIICYRYGPVENERTKKLIQWGLQAMGLLSIFFSSQYQEAAMGQVILVIFFNNLPAHWVRAPKTYWKRRFPPKVALLSNDQYYQQGVEETTKALNELRQFCSSPQCNQWKTALKLKDVKRFASFIEGNSHLSDEEILEYETSMQQVLTDEDDFSSSDED